MKIPHLFTLVTLLLMMLSPSILYSREIRLNPHNIYAECEVNGRSGSIRIVKTQEVVARLEACDINMSRQIIEARAGDEWLYFNGSELRLTNDEYKKTSDK